MLTDSAGIAKWRAAYSAYGRAALDEDPDNDQTNLVFNVRFPGQYYDAETETSGVGTGLHYNRYRYYDPNTGRYLSADPIGQSADSNVFVYAGLSPTSRIDYFGLQDSDAPNMTLDEAGDLLDDIYGSDDSDVAPDEDSAEPSGTPISDALFKAVAKDKDNPNAEKFCRDAWTRCVSETDGEDHLEQQRCPDNYHCALLGVPPTQCSVVNGVVTSLTDTQSDD